MFELFIVHRRELLFIHGQLRCEKDALREHDSNECQRQDKVDVPFEMSQHSTLSLDNTLKSWHKLAFLVASLVDGVLATASTTCLPLLIISLKHGFDPVEHLGQINNPVIHFIQL